MEELAEVAGKVVKGIAGLAYAFGDIVTALGGSQGTGKERKEKKDEGAADEER
ncbi:hypothetical protein AB0D45_31185 [Streptomyces sp. NPDC048352]|uniref:hypothetical protein n=1 Tax=Streptomyces sp. NPDC048352 TaxID=3154718 RepID=UPI00342B119B